MLVPATLFAGVLLAAEFCVSPDGALSSPQAAVVEVRNARRAGKIGTAERATVRMAAGVYRLDSPLVLTPEDSHIAFVGAVGGRSVISGGQILPSFVVGADGIWRARLPNGTAFEQIWVNGQRRERARTPNAGFFYMDRPADEQAARTAFFASPDDLNHLFGVPVPTLTNAVVQVWHSWFATRRRLRSLDLKTGRIVTEPQKLWNYFYWRPYKTRYRLENYMEALD